LELSSYRAETQDIEWDSNYSLPRIMAYESKPELSNRQSQGQMWPPAYIYVALKGARHKIIVIYELEWRPSF